LLIASQIAEVVIGSLSIVFSCILLGYIHSPERYSHSYHPLKNFNLGEGIWCSIWVCTWFFCCEKHSVSSQGAICYGVPSSGFLKRGPRPPFWGHRAVIWGPQAEAFTR